MVNFLVGIPISCSQSIYLYIPTQHACTFKTESIVKGIKTYKMSLRT